MVSYPRSQEFREAPINFKDYLVLGHTADQTHGTNQKETQGRQAMNILIPIERRWRWKLEYIPTWNFVDFN